MANVAIQHSGVLGGLNPVWTPAAATGDYFGPNSGVQLLEIKNAGPVTVLVTVAAQHNCDQNYSHPLTFLVPAGVTFITGPFDGAHYVDTNGNVNWTYSTTVQPAPGAMVPSLRSSSYGLGIGAYLYAATFVNSGETSAGTEVGITTLSGSQVVQLDDIPIGPGGTTARKIYRTPVNGPSSSKQLLVQLSDNTTTSFTDTIPDSLLGAAIPTVNASTIPPPGAVTLAAGGAGNPNGTYLGLVTFINGSGETTGGQWVYLTVTNQQINWSNVPLGPTGTTSRRLYRTEKLTGVDAFTMSTQVSITGGTSYTGATTMAPPDAATLSEQISISGGTTYTGTTTNDAPSLPGIQGLPTLAHLVTTLADNTTTSYSSDNLTDAQLAASAFVPLVDTANVVTVAVIAP